MTRTLAILMLLVLARPALAQQDELLATAVHEALAKDRRVDAQQVRVQAEGGTVWLLGEVDTNDERTAAEEVAERIRALLRRSTGHAQSELTCGPVTLDTRTGRVSVSGNPIKMTSHEYRLLAYLMHHTGRVVSRTELVEHLYDQDFDRDSNTIEVFVGRIRKKLDVDIIQTVRGLGYLLTPPSA